MMLLKLMTATPRRGRARGPDTSNEVFYFLVAMCGVMTMSMTFILYHFHFLGYGTDPWANGPRAWLRERRCPVQRQPVPRYSTQVGRIDSEEAARRNERASRVKWEGSDIPTARAKTVSANSTDSSKSTGGAPGSGTPAGGVTESGHTTTSSEIAGELFHARV
ncbi:hypothetical protein SKAU_G00095770 [Synaphobranchus kaupii]|uniref:Uncharacterized protein n=1 Tax=Synaphobranchus kaupii TaxID=118154 RepID=A0A9Q1FXA7_SYNKA|nr:hypothetical protein SKAU_G00095770 [Synaphobranchus kaupii]